MDIPKVTLPTVAIRGSALRFPVRRIYCVGQNYAEHAREMGSDPERHPPFFFGKPGDAVFDSGSQLVFPPKTQALHHEIEMVVALADGGGDISTAMATGLIWGYGAGVDLTRRDLQAEAKKLGRPWDMGKGFDRSAAVGPLTPGIPPAAAAISLKINGQLKQSGDVNQMIWGVSEIIAILSSYVRLAAGDLIFTGTPSGVGPMLPGDAVLGELAGAEPIRFGVVQ